MNLLKFPLIKLTFCLILGISIANYIIISVASSIVISSTLIFILFVLLLIKKQDFSENLFGVLSLLTMVSVGVLVYNLHDEKQFKTHYSNYINESENTNKITFRIREKLKTNDYYDKYVIDILEVDGFKVSGKSLLNINKDSLLQSYNIDDIIVTFSNFSTIKKPQNPNQFNYKNYLTKKYIYHQIYSENNSLLKIDSTTHTLYGYADKLRVHINSRLKSHNFKGDELAIINALLLGQRQDISKEIYNSYTNAGAIHILAVSGLHVGIVLLLLNFVFKPVEYLKHGKFIKIILLLFSLWSFAIIAGLSASVTRAVAMFSLVAIAINLKRKSNIYNTLAISMFLILLVKPMFLFDVGFQMSYLAVIAIVSIQPLIYKLWSPKIWTVDKLWQIFSVTVAAQFGVIPISLYYFHQFPGLFFVSNIAIIPFLGLILGFGIVVILLSLLNILPEFIAMMYSKIIQAMNSFINWVGKQEEFLLKDIPFGILEVIASYILILSFYKLYKNRNFASLRLSMFSIIVFQIVFIYNKHKTATDEFIIFNKSRYSLIAEKSNTDLKVFHNLDSITKSKDNTLKNYRVGSYISEIKNDTLKSVYRFNDKTFLIIDSLGVYNVKSFKPDYILLRNSPRINLKRVIDSLQPQQIIADASNYKSYVKRWKATCEKEKLPFHSTYEKGAFIIIKN